MLNMKSEIQGAVGAARPYLNPYLAGVLLGLTLLASFAFLGAGLGASADAPALREAFATTPKAQTLVAGVFDFSPYLSDLARADPERLVRLLRENPESHFQAS